MGRHEAQAACANAIRNQSFSCGSLRIDFVVERADGFDEVGFVGSVLCSSIFPMEAFYAAQERDAKEMTLANPHKALPRNILHKPCKTRCFVALRQVWKGGKERSMRLQMALRGLQMAALDGP